MRRRSRTVPLIVPASSAPSTLVSFNSMSPEIDRPLTVRPALATRTAPLTVSSVSPPRMSRTLMFPEMDLTRIRVPSGAATV